jgi:hypothetical protein
MKFSEAKDELKKLAKGKMHSITYELIEYASGAFDTRCDLYIDSRISSSGTIWKDALDKIRIKLGGCGEVDLTEAPGEEKGKEE